MRRVRVGGRWGPTVIPRKDLVEFLSRFVAVEGAEVLPEFMDWKGPKLTLQDPGCRMEVIPGKVRFYSDPYHQILGTSLVDPDPAALFKVSFVSGTLRGALVVTGREERGRHRVKFRWNGMQMGSWPTPEDLRARGSFVLVLGVFDRDSFGRDWGRPGIRVEVFRFPEKGGPNEREEEDPGISGAGGAGVGHSG